MKKIALSLLLALGLSSCTDVVEIDLNTVSPKVVIEGNISDQKGAYTVKVSQSVNFSDTNVYPAVKNANVVIADNAGNTEILTETSAGTYQTKKLQGVAGQTYTLTVTADGKTYTAISTIPKPVPFENVRFLEQANFPRPGQNETPETTYIAIPVYTDPANEQNNYRFIQYANGKTDQGLVVRNDNINNGLVNEQPIFSSDFDFKIRKGDTITIEMFCIDKATYEYFYSFNQSSGNGPGGGSTPANPVSNIKGGALGYFSAHSIQQKTVVVP
jgi:hypothetical protein